MVRFYPVLPKSETSEGNYHTACLDVLNRYLLQSRLFLALLVSIYSPQSFTLIPENTLWQLKLQLTVTVVSDAM